MNDVARALADVVESLDRVWSQVATRRAGMSHDEYVWEPVDGCWSVRGDASGAEDDAHVDWVDDEPTPAPVTTIAWREWHIAADCLDSYAVRLDGTTGAGLGPGRWVLDVERSGVLMQQAWDNFRRILVDGGPAQLLQPLGDGWGPHATRTRLALALHAQHEVAHHGAEIALLRDLYARRV